MSHPPRSPAALFALLAVLGLALGGCNTMSGIGQDVEAAGDAITDTAEDTKEQM